MEAQIKELQELALAAIPPWHHYFARPFEQQILREHMSLSMYYCLQALRRQSGTVTMTELARLTHAPKQRMTRLVDQLAERGFVERISDPNDRRVIRLRVTDSADAYIDRFLEQDAACYRELFARMSADDRASLRDALATIRRVLDALPHEDCASARAEERCGKEGSHA